MLSIDQFHSLLESHGEDVKTVQELLRHANNSVTLNSTRRLRPASSGTRRAKRQGWSSNPERPRRGSERLIGLFWTGATWVEVR